MQPQAHEASRNRLSLVLLSVLFLIIAACGGAAPSTTRQVTKAAANQQILVLPFEGTNDLSSFDPALATDDPAITSINLVFTGLVTLDSSLQVRDQLAESHAVAADGVTWTFHLRPNLKFSDGASLTSKDVAYSIDRALKPSLKSPVAPLYLGLIKDADKRNAGQISTLIGDSILTPDPQTVVLITSHKAAYFLQTLTYPNSYVVEKSMIDKYGDNFADHLSEGIGGDGPFKVAQYVHGQDIEFVPNPNYYGPQPQLKKIIFHFYQSIDTSFQAYRTDQIDQASVQSGEMQIAKTLPGQQLREEPLLELFFFGMNYLVKPFDNIKIRQAFALAINKNIIAHNIYRDTVIASNHIVPTGMPGYNQNLTGPQGEKTPAGDTQLAKKLFSAGLQEEGYTLSTFPPVSLTYSPLGSADVRNEMAAVQQMWSTTLGVNVKLNDIDFNKLVQERNASINNPNGLQMWALYWFADYPDPQDWLTLIFDKGSSKNAMNYGVGNTAQALAQQANQKLMEQADATQDAAARMQVYNQAEQKLVNDVAWIPRYQAKSTFVRKPCVVGIVDNPQGLYPPDSWGDIYISTAQPCANIQSYT